MKAPTTYSPLGAPCKCLIHPLVPIDTGNPGKMRIIFLPIREIRVGTGKAKEKEVQKIKKLKKKLPLKISCQNGVNWFV